MVLMRKERSSTDRPEFSFPGVPVSSHRECRHGGRDCKISQTLRGNAVIGYGCCLYLVLKGKFIKFYNFKISYEPRGRNWQIKYHLLMFMKMLR